MRVDGTAGPEKRSGGHGASGRGASSGGGGTEGPGGAKLEGAAATRAGEPRSGRTNQRSQRFVTLHGYRRAYLRAGRGPAVLLIHGIGDSSATWKPVLSRLARRHTVIAPDLLGHGLSDKPRGDYSLGGFACGMRDLLTVLGIDRVTVVGHSLGGGVAMQFAYQFPERCERLVLVGTGGVGPQLHPALRLAATPGGEALLSLLRLPPARLAGRGVFGALSLLGADLGRDAADLGQVFDALTAPGARAAFLRTLRAAADSRGQAITMLDRCYLAQGMPTLIIWGEHDAVIPVTHARIAHEAMPGSRLEIFPDAGHFPHHTDPDRFQAVLEDFLATTRPASHSARKWRALLRSRSLPPGEPLAGAVGTDSTAPAGQGAATDRPGALGGGTRGARGARVGTARAAQRPAKPGRPVERTEPAESAEPAARTEHTELLGRFYKAG